MASAATSCGRTNNPIDLIEQIAYRNDWGHERSSDDELTLIVGGTWTDYHVSINWRHDLEALHLTYAGKKGIVTLWTREARKLL